MQTPRLTPPTDDELDAYIRLRYRLLDIDISVLPASDSEAPMDQVRLLENGRSILRQDVAASNILLDPQSALPMPYPAPFTAWSEESEP